MCRNIFSTSITAWQVEPVDEETACTYGVALIVINSALAALPAYVLYLWRSAGHLAELEEVARCKRAIQDSAELRFPCHFMRFTAFRARGKLVSYESIMCGGAP